MPELDLISSANVFPLYGSLIVVVIHLYKKVDNMQKTHNEEMKTQLGRYEEVLRELERLRGRIEAEIQIEDKIYNIVQEITKKS
jgi:uncharacterized membrane protein